MSLTIQIFDHSGDTQYVSWSKGQFMGYTHTHEMPSGMLSCSFDVPVEYSMPYKWADAFNIVKVFHESTPVFTGLMWGLGRYWDENSSGISVGCVGLCAKFGMLTTATNLSNEKGSTFINDHILTASEEIASWIGVGEIATTDYTIPGTLEHKPYAYFRECLDEIWEYNEDIYNWYVRNEHFFYLPKETELSYETSTRFSTGSLTQDLSEFGNDIRYSYRDANGVIQSSYERDSDSAYPLTKLIESYSDNMTAAQAETRAEASLEEHKVLGATGGVTVSKLWRPGGGEVHPSEVFAGKVIRVEGLVAARATPAEAFTKNDIDVFEIKSCTYDHDSQTVDISPGRMPHSLYRRLARKRR